MSDRPASDGKEQHKDQHILSLVHRPHPPKEWPGILFADVRTNY